MLIEYLVPITIAFVLAALALLATSLILSRRVGQSSEAVQRAARFLDDRTDTLPIALSSARAELAERDAGIEMRLWTLARLDSQLGSATSALAEQRRALDDMRERLVASRVGIERIKSALRMIMRAIELRRTILG